MEKIYTLANDVLFFFKLYQNSMSPDSEPKNREGKLSPFPSDIFFWRKWKMLKATMTWKSSPTLLRAMLIVKVEASWWGRRERCRSGEYFTTKFNNANPCKSQDNQMYVLFIQIKQIKLHISVKIDERQEKR